MKKYYQKLKEDQRRKKEFSVYGVSTENKEEITRLLEKKFDELFGTDSESEC